MFPRVMPIGVANPMQARHRIPVTRHLPRVFRDEMQEMQGRSALPPVGDIVASLIGASTPISNAALAARWHDIGNEDGAAAFGAFLIQLRDTVNADNPEVRRVTVELVKQLTDDPALRAQIFAISVGATETCEDRVSHTLLMMLSTARAATFTQTPFTCDHEAIAVQRQFHRLELLHKLAEDIVGETHNGKEHLETDHYLQVKHGAALKLDGLVPKMDMRWDMCARVTPERDATIVATIKRQENDQFARWLSHSPSWMDYMRVHFETIVDKSREALTEAFDQPFRDRLDEQLRATGLDKAADPAAWSDAERILGKVLSDALTERFNRDLTHDFLDLRGVLYLLQNQWPEEECAPKATAS